MRTTVTLDPDARLLVERAMRERDLTFKVALNEAIRAGLGQAPQSGEAPTVPRDMGAPLMDLTAALRLAGDLEDEAIARKLAEGR